MSSSSPIGGYFELELPTGGLMHSDAILLASGRNCLEYILKARDPSRVFLPKYTCDTILEPLQLLKIPYEFYALNSDLELASKVDLKPGELIIYNNYFGLKDTYASELSDKYADQLVLDNSQAYYAAPSESSDSFYSPRKFFGVPDGGCLYTHKKLEVELPPSTSHQRTSHLLKRLDLGAEAAYANFQENEGSFSGQPLSLMSPLTRRLLQSIDYQSARRARLQNFQQLHEALGAINKFKALGSGYKCPMVYPFIPESVGVRQALADQNIFAPTYWPNVLEWSEETDTEHQLASSIIPLPIDQRYSGAEMERIIQAIRESTD